MTDLFTEAQAGTISCQNRIFMAPLTRNRAQSNGVPGELAKTYYAQRASAGLIVSEATQISAEAKGYINTPGIYTDEHVEGWRDITDAVHNAGGAIVLQLWHVGRISHQSLLPDGEKPLAPSAIRADAQTVTEKGRVDTPEPRAMTLEDVTRTMADYRHAAECAKRAGFDGVEVHGANGYLINQFLCDHSNRREDAYGGSVENRARFLMDVLDAVVDVWGADKVGLRLSPTGTFNDMADSNPRALYSYVIEQLNRYGLAYLHFVERFGDAALSQADEKLLVDLRQQWQGFYIANGDYDFHKGQRAIQSGHADAVAYGRPFIANPDLPERFAKGAALNEPDQNTFYGGGAEGYTDYPFMKEAQSA